MRNAKESSIDGPVSCPACGAKVSGKFCSDCGATLRPGHCQRCRSELGAGAKYCSECGAAASPGTAGAGSGWTAPRLVTAFAGIAFLAVLITQLAARNDNPPESAGAPVAMMGGGVAPDISSMSPRQQAAALYDRVMRLHEQRKADSVEFFMPMALQSFASIPDIDADGRYDMARLAMVGGSMDVARAQVDTLLRADSTHLLGLMAAIDVARAKGDAATAARLESKLIASESRERARKLPEYEAHAGEIDRVLERLKSPAKRE